MYLRFAHESMSVYEHFTGFYETFSITIESLYKIVKDVLIRAELPLADCRGQGSDGVSNVSSHRHGLQTQIQADEPRAVFVHCLAHNLNLTAQDYAIK